MKLIRKKLSIVDNCIAEEWKARQFISSNGPKALPLSSYSSFSDPGKVVHQGEVSRASAN